MSSLLSYVLIMVEGIEDVVGQTGEKVDDEPRLEIVDSDDGGVRHHLPPRSHVGGVEVEDDVNEEDHVHDGVDHQETDVLRGFVF